MRVKPVQPVEVWPKEVSEHLGSYPGDGEGDRSVEASGTEIRFGRVSERAGGCRDLDGLDTKLVAGDVLRELRAVRDALTIFCAALGPTNHFWFSAK